MVQLTRFCVGDRFYLCENKILCEYDYEERLVFANMALHPPPTATLAHIKRQVTHLQPQNVAGAQARQTNGDVGHNHNGYQPAATSTGAHNALNPMNNLNGINAQATYDAK
uniref:Lmo3 protein n=1 Tax=Fopius arisanus TaxID=64838 RepID=A0A0C9S061_9HYME